MSESKRFSGIWHNKYGSELNLEVDASGRIQGKFRTAVGRVETQHLWKDTWFDVVGFANGDLISLAVNFGHDAKATSAISGTLVLQANGDRTIETLSYTRFSLAKEDSWRETNTAALTYYAGPAKGQ